MRAGGGQGEPAPAARPNIAPGLGRRQPAGAAVRLAGRTHPPLRLTDVSAPAALLRAGWAAHAARFDARDVAFEVASGVAFGVAFDGAVSPAADPAPGGWPALVVPADPALARAAAPRVAAFLAGRYCASRALAALGRPTAAVPVGEAGAPVWPAGVVGAISHATTRAVAVVAPASRWRGVGVDCEALLDAPGAAAVAPLVLPEADAVTLEGPAPCGPALVTLGFSAKESLYKCLRPLVGAYFGFEDARLTRVRADGPAGDGPGAGRAWLQLTHDLAPAYPAGATFEAAYAIEGDHVYTCVALGAEGP